MQIGWIFSPADDGDDDDDDGGYGYLLTFPLPLLRSDERNSHDFVLWSVSTVAASKKPSYAKHFESSDVELCPKIAEVPLFVLYIHIESFLLSLKPIFQADREEHATRLIVR